MNGEIPKLMDGELSELERTLLTSARLDQPSAASMAKAAEALGVGGAVTAAKWAGLAKWSAAVGVAGALGLLGLRTLRVDPPPTSEVVSAPVLPAPVASGSGAPVESPPSELAEVPVSPVGNAPLRARPAASASIADEISAMQAARAALAAGQSRKALDLVGDYRKRFVRPAFGEEATVIRILALAGSGQKTQATREARAFLARHPKSPHSPRLRTLVEP